LHFHRFMQLIHAELRALGEIENPLARIADKWIKHTRLLVLDEMHVNDITDAMLIGGLLTELFDRGLTMVTTSNVTPDDLYKDGLQRARFLPAIDQIKQHTRVHDLQGDMDYRLRILENADIYFDSTNAASDAALDEKFTQLVRAETVTSDPLSINERDIPVVKRAETAVWFTFDALCNTPRSGVNLVASAGAEPEKLYTGQRLSFEFVRAASRLREMQTHDYLARSHL